MSTEEIKAAGYDHPPRAARDVRELGFDLKTVPVKSSSGRFIASYTLGSLENEVGKFGRAALPKKMRDAIISKAGKKCQICGATHNLQVDHRIPYEVAGESEAKKEEPYQVLCGSCNRKKSWDCEHCKNWRDLKDIELCRTCYWANSETYEHIALRSERRVEIIWNEEDFKNFGFLREQAHRTGKSIADLIKEKLFKRSSRK